MPLNDHVLLLQLERAYEALNDTVDDVLDDNGYADVDHDHDEYARDRDLGSLHDDVLLIENHVKGNDQRIEEIDVDIDDHEERITALKARVATLDQQVDALEMDLAGLRGEHEQTKAYLAERIAALEQDWRGRTRYI